MRSEQLFRVEGLSAVVTGGAVGIGHAYAEAMAANGARVVLFDRDADALAQAVDALRAAGGDAHGLEVDVTDHAALDDAMRRVAAEAGALDVVFANAGITAGPGFLTTDGERVPEGALENIAPALWQRVMDVNLGGVFATVRAALPAMKAQRSGRLIVTTSIANQRPSVVVGTPYMVAKAAAAHLVRQAALELAAFGICVNAIAPGPFATRITSPDLKALWQRALPLGRVAGTDELHGLALFLASPAAAYVTGQQFTIDGGSLLGKAD